MVLGLPLPTSAGGSTLGAPEPWGCQDGSGTSGALQSQGDRAH